MCIAYPPSDDLCRQLYVQYLHNRGIKSYRQTFNVRKSQLLARFIKRRAKLSTSIRTVPLRLRKATHLGFPSALWKVGFIDFLSILHSTMLNRFQLMPGTTIPLCPINKSIFNGKIFGQIAIFEQNLYFFNGKFTSPIIFYN